MQTSKVRNQELPYLGSLQFGGPGGTATLKHQVKNNVMVEIITAGLARWYSGSLIYHMNWLTSRPNQEVRSGDTLSVAAQLYS
jgi:hypothetical protein